MLHKTKAIVMRSVKYGETSLIVTLFTELFGMQSYMVKGVRKEAVKSSLRASQFQPATLLDLVVTHQERQGLQHIRECRWAVLYTGIDRDIRKQSVAVFMIELLMKCNRHPDPQPDLFHFVDDALVALDLASPVVTANFPIYFSIHLSHFFGFRMEDTYDADHNVLDLLEGVYLTDQPDHPHWVGGDLSHGVSQFLKAQQPEDLQDFGLTRDLRRRLLDACLQFYAIHMQDFGKMRSIPVLQEILD